MTKLNKEIQEVYDKLDYLKELLEFDNVDGEHEKHLQVLDEAEDALNRYISVLEKFDRTGKNKS